MFGLENAQSLVGVASVLLICWAVSENRGRFPIKLAVGAILTQAVLVLLLFGVPPLRDALQGVGIVVDGLATSTQAGVAFVFGFLAGTPNQPYPLTDGGALFVFAFRVLPVILIKRIGHIQQDVRAVVDFDILLIRNVTRRNDFNLVAVFIADNRQCLFKIIVSFFEVTFRIDAVKNHNTIFNTQIFRIVAQRNMIIDVGSNDAFNI
eukprot:gene63156-86390_t